MRIEAVRNFTGPEGIVKVGDTLEVTADRAKLLIDLRIAKAVKEKVKKEE